MARYYPRLHNLFFILLIVLFTQSVQASGLLKPSSSLYQDLVIDQHHVEVVIEDTYATTIVEQEFYNPNEKDLDTIYSFPVPKDAVVGEFIYWINGQPVVAEAVEKENARKVYQDQKEQGRSTAVAEKDSYKTFDISVYPVPAKQSVKVRLVYMQDVKLEHGVGRYVYPMEEGGVDEQKESFWSRNDIVRSDFSFLVTMRSVYPVDAVRLPKHPHAVITQTDGNTWQASFSSSNGVHEEDGTSPLTQFRMDQDIVTYWRHVEGLPGRLDLISYRDPAVSSKGTVKLTFTPGDDLTPVSSERDWVFILDNSGSMKGKFATLVEGVRQGLATLPSSDRFRVVTFNNSAVDITSGFESVTQQSVEKALKKVETMGTGGGTNLYAGLELGIDNLDSDRPTGVVLVTDGVANVGVTEKEQFLKFLRKKDIRLFTFVMGNSANEPLLEAMTQISNGFAQNISNSDDIQGHLMTAVSKINHHAYRNVKVDIGGVRVKNLTPEEINSLYRGEQLSMFGHYFKPGNVRVTLTATRGGEVMQYSTEITLPESDLRNPELERLWAFSAIKTLQGKMDYVGHADADMVQAMTDIALEYGLLTDYTSLLVVEEEVFQQLNIDRKNAARVQKEQKAREQRKNSEVRSTRADDNQPAFNSPAPSSGNKGSGGSIGVIGVLLSSGLLIIRRRKGRKTI